jgi:UDP-N-acetylmuramoylalanine--D-glutamate ligase
VNPASHHKSFEGKRVTVIGFGIEGVSLVKYLASHGAIVTVSDARSESQLTERLDAIRGMADTLSLGRNDLSAVEGADAVFVSQGVPLDLPPVAAARAQGIPIRSVTGLFVGNWNGPIAAITGSAGKTTTTSLVDAMFTAAGEQHLLVGNIGAWPLEQLDAGNDGRWAVMEISHTQLQLVDIRPRVACITNITPNHLDRFTWDEYMALKRNLVSRQAGGDWTVLNYDDPEGWNARHAGQGQVHAFSRRAVPAPPATFVKDGTAWIQTDGPAVPLFEVSVLRLRGLHNLENALAAATVARLSGIPASAIRTTIRDFRGVAHRLELVDEIDGVAYYNDSIATAPERTLAGMRSFHEPLVMLLGGRDKHLPMDELAQECYRRCRSVILFGEAAGLIESAFTANRPSETAMTLLRTDTLDEAVTKARQVSRSGDIVLLSPACTSFDAYQNFEERGAHFRRLVHALNAERPREKERV